MLRKYKFFFLFVLAFSLICTPLIFFNNIIKADTKVQYIFDNAGYLTDSEFSKLEKKLEEVSEDTKSQVVIVTTATLNNKTEKKYLEDFFDSGYENGSLQADTVLLLFGIDEQGRFIAIQGYGICEYYINNDRIQNIMDEVKPYLIDEKYYKAFAKYASEVDYYMHLEHGVSFDPSKPHGDTATAPSARNQKPIYYRWWFQLLVALGIGGISVACMAYSSGGRTTTNASTYFDPAHSGVTAHRDNYIRTSITKVHKPKESSNHSGSGYQGRGSGGGGVSSGGHSHSGGSSRF